MQQVASRIRDRMTALDISVKALSDMAAIPRMTLTRRLTDPASLTLNELERIADVLQTSPVFLATGVEAAA